MSELQIRISQTMQRMVGRPVRNVDLRIVNHYSQTYTSGPVAWIASIHIDRKASTKHPIDAPVQITVTCTRMGRVSIAAEYRRHPSKGYRVTCPADVFASAQSQVERIGQVLDLPAIDPDYSEVADTFSDLFGVSL